MMRLKKHSEIGPADQNLRSVTFCFGLSCRIWGGYVIAMFDRP
jgi:hypothetical protein